MNKFQPCERCSNGYIYTNDIAIRCDCLKEYQRQLKFEISLMKAGLENFSLNFNHYKGRHKESRDKLIQYCENINSKYSTNSHLYLIGKNGTQKTTMAKCLLAECVYRGKSGKFILMSDLVDILTDVYSDNPTRNSELEYLRTVDILVIDDAFDKNKVTLYRSGYQLAFIDRFIRNRIEVSKLNTIFTSNVPISDIQKNGFTYDIQNLLERSIKVRDGELEFIDVYVENEVNIDSLWD